MHTLQQLTSGELNGIKHLKLSCGLTEFPPDIFSLAETLEVLDLSGNVLSGLPDDFGRLAKLKIVFFSDNLFTELPSVLSDCKHLSMIGFKSNRIAYIPENALPPSTRWLILTNNRIKHLPASIGQCNSLQKVALAGNFLSALPPEMINCRNLELLRISANRFNELPGWLFDMPKLSWLAFAGNPFYKIEQRDSVDLPEIDWESFDVQEQLGEGASGNIYRAVWQNNENKTDVAIKLYKGEVTSDGFPDDEMQAAITAAKHPCLVNLLGTIFNHPHQKQGLVMALIPPTFYNLGLPPSWDTCSRDVFPEGSVFKSHEILKIATAIASLADYLHQKGIMHGDLYAHNILIDQHTNTLMGDFGAASFYDVENLYAKKIQQIEARAYGCLLDDLLQRLDSSDDDQETISFLMELRKTSMQETTQLRPLFGEICRRLSEKNSRV